MDGQQQPPLTGRAKSLHILHRHHHDSSRRRDTIHDSFHHHPSDHFSDPQDPDYYDSSSPALELRTVSDSDSLSTEQAPVAADSHPHAVAATSTFTPAASNAYIVAETSVNSLAAATSSDTATSVTASTSLLADIRSTTSWFPTAAPSPTTSTNVILTDLRNGTNAMPNTTSSLVISSSPLSSTSPSLFNSTSLPSIVNTSSPTSSSFEASVLSKTTSLTWTSTVTQASSTTVRHLTKTTDFESEVTEYADSESTSLDTDSSYFFSPATRSSSDGGATVAAPTRGISPNTGTGAGSKAAAPPEALPPKERAIVGVVTSVAGVAFLVLLAMLALRYHKKRKDGCRSLLRAGHLGSTAPRTIEGGRELMVKVERPVAPPPAGGFVGSGGDAPADGAEQRGFYRVAGRKLPPVLITGGDGYSDPRGTMMSDDYGQGPHTLEPAGSSSSRPLALGTPMRPVSGIPILRSGPARTPVTQNPFADPPSSPGGQDGARDRSRFHEGI
ncbi:hypothetical protein L249_6243 [Ophiocordyceps polyrhachis-furcata BCC 54312]|uniref:Uncharacterized protein n=1 Tax=Ophiocordyceps polyrhachis-furcata BCC 54312 TaxID=1330021 RepID=A0A367L181_9HYPO|nr:hypothetical protein L249_6243 [Ophiocordyceps polyrhachis-furcata BCC 54312]